MYNVQVSQYNAIIERYAIACKQYVAALTNPKYTGERNTLVYPLTTYMWGSADKYGTQGMEDYNSLATIGRTFLASFMGADRAINLTSSSGGSVLATYLGVLTLDTAFVYNSQYPAGVYVTMSPLILRALVQSGEIVEGAENAENFIQKFSLQDGGKFLRSKINFNEFTIPVVELKPADSQGTTFKLISRTITLQVCTGVIIPRMGMTVLSNYLCDAFSQGSMALKKNGLTGIYTRNVNLITSVYGKDKAQEIMQNLSRASESDSDTVVPAVRLDGSSQTTCIAYIDVATVDAAVVYPLSQGQIRELAENSKLDVSQTRRYIMRYLDADQLSVDMMRQICVACAKLPEIKRLGNKLSASNPETYGARASAGMVKQACTELVLASYDAHLFSVLKEFDGLQGKLFLAGINQVSPHYGTPSVVWDSNSGTLLDKSVLLRELRSGVCNLEIATARGAIVSMTCTKNGEALQKYIGNKYLEWEDKSTKFKMFAGIVRRLCDGANMIQTMILESKAEQLGLISDYNKAYAELVTAGKLKDVAIIDSGAAEMLLVTMNSNISTETAERRAKRRQSGSYDGLVSVRVLTALQASEYIRSINISNIRKIISYR